MKMKNFLALSFFLTVTVFASPMVIKPGEEIRFQDADKSNYTGFKGATAAAGNYILTLPSTLGASGEALLTNGSGALYWGAGGGGGGGSGDAVLAADNVFTGNNLFDTGVNQFNNTAKFFAQSSAVSVVALTDGQESVRLVTNNPYNAVRVGTVSATGRPLISLTTGAAADGSTSGTEVSGFGYVGDATPTYSRITAGVGPTNIITWVNGAGATQYNVGIGTTIIHPSTKLQVFGDLGVGGNSSVSDLRFFEASGNGVNYVGFKAPSAITTNKVYILPAVDGTIGQFLMTDGSGTMSWSSDASALTGVPAAQVTGTFTSIVTSGSISRDGVQVLTPNALGAFAIDVTKGNNTKTIADGSDGTDTFTFSATPSSGTLFGLELTNADLDTDDVITVPSSWSQNAGATITTFTLKRGGKLELVWKKTASGYSVFGDPVDVTGVDAAMTTDDTASGSQVAGMVNSGGITQWDAVYINGSGQWVRADANGSGTYPARGLAMTTQSTGEATSVITSGVVKNGGWSWTVGGIVYLSTTGTSTNTLTQTAPSTTGDSIQVIGEAISATSILLHISPDYGTAP